MTVCECLQTHTWVLVLYVCLCAHRMTDMLCFSAAEAEPSAGCSSALVKDDSSNVLSLSVFSVALLKSSRNYE